MVNRTIQTNGCKGEIVTDFESKALKLLSKQNALVGPGYFGSILWPDTRRPTWAFARPAGKVLNSLKRLGYAEYIVIRGPNNRATNWGWHITTAGAKAAKS